MPKPKLDLKTLIPALTAKLEAKLKSDKERKAVLAIVAGFCVVLLIVDVWFLMRPRLQAIGACGAKIAKLQKDTNTLIKELAKSQAQKNQGSPPAQQAALKIKSMVFKDQVPSLLQEISALANKNSVRIMQIQPKKEERTKATGGAIPLLVSLDVLCGYHQCGSFIDDLEKTDTFLAVEEMGLASDTVNVLQQKLTLGLRTYVKE